jgi:hypothetical protein
MANSIHPPGQADFEAGRLFERALVDGQKKQVPLVGQGQGRRRDFQQSAIRRPPNGMVYGHEIAPRVGQWAMNEEAADLHGALVLLDLFLTFRKQKSGSAQGSIASGTATGSAPAISWQKRGSPSKSSSVIMLLEPVGGFWQSGQNTGWP